VAKWTDAIDYCEALSLGGHDDWRLPNFNELYSIADRSKRNPAIDTTVFENVVSDYYWSSSTVVGSENAAWSVHFDAGDDRLSDKSIRYYVRCVRAGQ
jgi:EAL domain-containing protein (putative c-di-GMP-specific phosphodiesterase class I)